MKQMSCARMLSYTMTMLDKRQHIPHLEVCPQESLWHTTVRAHALNAPCALEAQSCTGIPQTCQTRPLKHWEHLPKAKQLEDEGNSGLPAPPTLKQRDVCHEKGVQIITIFCCIHKDICGMTKGMGIYILSLCTTLKLLWQPKGDTCFSLRKTGRQST